MASVCERFSNEFSSPPIICRAT
ncbi:hypothetical protein CCACVL1_24814 [Corchorus capsularis]|uniref:Uncharacterized protein n=1 Tax=Corchorus capsularis TaxID=210143 RepID=A0A1R3GN47_COCAP|nr:hypothetical protein CCACVL1_24814 [Corchorus capsularis]